MALDQQLSDSTSSIFQMFGLTPTDLSQSTDGSLVSFSSVNVLLGFAGGARGNAYIGMPYDTAFYLASHMLGSPVTELDMMAASALSELGNMLFGSTINGLQSTTAIVLSPPTLVHGQRMTLIISRAKSTVVKLKLSGHELSVAMAVE